MQLTAPASTAYQAPGDIAADARREPTVVVTYDLGGCGGRSMYRRLSWFFPEEGQSFDPKSYFNICTGVSFSHVKQTP
jgi:hypothetical protein